MLTRRSFLGVVGGAAAGVALPIRDAWAAGKPAWPGPIGLELYTVRDRFAKDAAASLKEVAAAGYREVEIGPGTKPGALKEELRAAGLTAPSGYFDAPKSLEEWKKSVGQGRDYGLQYIVIGDNPVLDAAAWRRRAEFFNKCGELSKQAGIQFCYHAHFREFAKVDGTCGYDIMLKNCDPNLLKMEMDIFWVTYAGADPLHYWRVYPGRFPLLHIKDLRKGVKISQQEDPPANGPNPFAPVGRGRIDWERIFAHVHEAGAKHIFVEQDRCDLPELQAIRISYDYLRNLRLS
ncbi:MAG TPA: sugar phosphate isomerase/epimerase [Terriglobia bacterium]|nr:sugar phosphate isomerase/epimerase [Terriglobia bacterium]